MALIAETNLAFNQAASYGVCYEDLDALRQVEARLTAALPLVSSASIDALRSKLANLGHGFVLQIGDCAEPFADATTARTQSKAAFYTSMRQTMAEALGQSVLLMARMAGQYWKPRSLAYDEAPQGSVMSYRGEGVHGFDSNLRSPDPERLWLSYTHAQSVWRALHAFPETIDVAHEALSLPYEQSLTRQHEGFAYDHSAQCLWLGMRTLESQAHLAHLAMIRNPVALKIGPSYALAALLDAIRRLNPHGEVGRLMLITRLGAACARERLPALIESVQALGLPVIWLVDPMHGNTHKDPWGRKYRLMSAMEQEVLDTFHAHQACGSRLGGMHMEASGDPALLECVDSMEQLHPDRVYHSLVDPRLNASQCIRLIQTFAKGHAGLGA